MSERPALTEEGLLEEKVHHTWEETETEQDPVGLLGTEAFL